MKNNIHTLSAFADLINASDNWELSFTDIIEANGWTEDTAEYFGICHTDTEVLAFDDNGVAVVRDREFFWWLYDVTRHDVFDSIMDVDSMEEATDELLRAWERLSGSDQKRRIEFAAIRAPKTSDGCIDLEASSDSFDIVDAHEEKEMGDLVQMLNDGVSMNVVRFVGRASVLDYIDICDEEWVAVTFDENATSAVAIREYGEFFSVETIDFYDEMMPEAIRAAIRDVKSFDVDDLLRVSMPDGRSVYVCSMDVALDVINDEIGGIREQIVHFPKVVNIFGDDVLVDYHCAWAEEEASVWILDEDGKENFDKESLFDASCCLYRYRAKYHRRDAACIFANDDMVEAAAMMAIEHCECFLANSKFEKINDEDWQDDDQVVRIVVPRVASVDPLHGSFVVCK